MRFKTKCKINLFQYGFSYKNLPAQRHYTAISREKEAESQGQNPQGCDEALNSIKRHSKIKINKFARDLERLHHRSTFSKSISILCYKQLSEKLEVKVVSCWTQLHYFPVLVWIFIWGFSLQYGEYGIGGKRLKGGKKKRMGKLKD